MFKEFLTEGQQLIKKHLIYGAIIGIATLVIVYALFSYNNYYHNLQGSPDFKCVYIVGVNNTMLIGVDTNIQKTTQHIFYEHMQGTHILENDHIVICQPVERNWTEENAQAWCEASGVGCRR